MSNPDPSSRWCREKNPVRTAAGRVVALAALTLVSTADHAGADMLVNPPAVAPLANAPVRPALAVDGRGRQILLGGQGGVMTVATSPDDGRTWTQPVVLESSTGLYSGAALCVDRFSRAFAVWRYAAAGADPGEIHAASFRFIEAATGSIPPQSVFRVDKDFDTTDSGEPVIDCNEEGMSLIVWEERRALGGHDLLGAMVQVFERDRSRLLKISAPSAEDNRMPDVDLRAGGAGYVVFQARYFNRTDIYLASVTPSPAVKVRKIPTDGAVVPPILVHNEIEPRIAHRSARVPAVSPEARELVVAWLDDRDGFFRTLATFSIDGGESWFTDVNLPTAPDGGACQSDQSMPRVCRGSAGVVVGFRCVDPPAAGNVAFTNSSRDLGQTWESSPAQPLDDEGSSDLQAFELQCAEEMTPDAHAAVRVTPREGRQYHAGGRGPGPDFSFEPHTEPADGLPQDHGQLVSLAHDEGQAWIAIDMAARGVMAVNGTTAKTRLDIECPAGVCTSTEPSIALGSAPYLHAAWLSRASIPSEIRAAVSADAGGRWVPSQNAVASGNVAAPFLLATERTDMFGLSPVLTLYLDRGGIVTPQTLRSSLSVDRGSTWNDAGQVNTTPLADDVMVSGMGAIVQGRSRFYAAWIHGNGQSGEVRFSFLTQSGWSQDVRLDTPPGPLAGHPVGRPRVAGDDQANVCVFWEDRRDPNDVQIRVNCSSDGGATFQPADTRLDEPDGIPSTDPDIATDGLGHYAVVWREQTPTGVGDALVTRHTCQVGGPSPTTWSAPVKIPSIPSGGPIYAPQITLETGGHTVVAWDNGFRVYSNFSKNWGNSFNAGATPLAVCSSPGAPAVNCGDGVRLFARPEGGVALSFQHEDIGGRGVSALTTDDFGSGAAWSGPFTLTPDGGNGHEPNTGGAGAYALHQALHGPPTALLAAWATTGNAIAAPDIAVNRWRIPNGVPPEMKVVLASPSGLFTWEPFDLPSGAAAVYDVYRGALPVQSPSVPWSCVAQHLPDSRYQDPVDPAPGGILAYVITGVGPGGEGPSGTRIPLASCEPPPPPCF